MTEFDLKGTRELPAVVQTRWIHFISGVGAIILVALSVRFLFVTLENGWSVPTVVALPLLLVIDAGSAIIYLGSSPQPHELRTDADCLRFTFSRRRIWVQRWDDARLKLKLLWTESGSARNYRSGPVFDLRGRRPFHTFLTREAFQEVLAQAERHGLAVERRPGPDRGWESITIRQSTLKIKS